MSHEKPDFRQTLPKSPAKHLAINDGSLQNMFPNILKKRRKGIKINLSITPISTKKCLIKQNPRLTQIKRQIQQTASTKNTTKEINPKKLINEMIKEYNELIEHKQFSKQKNKIKNKNAQELHQMLQIIRLKQKQFNQSNNLITKYNHNLQITRLYRQCSNSMSIHHKFAVSPHHQRRVERSVQSVIQVTNQNNKKNEQNNKIESKLKFFLMDNCNKIDDQFPHDNYLKNSLNDENQNAPSQNTQLKHPQYHTNLTVINSPIRHWKMIQNEKRIKNKKQLYPNLRINNLFNKSSRNSRNIIKSQLCLSEQKYKWEEIQRNSQKYGKDHQSSKQIRKLDNSKGDKDIIQDQFVNSKKVNEVFKKKIIAQNQQNQQTRPKYHLENNIK